MKTLASHALVCALPLLIFGCSGQKNDQVAERARLEGKAQAEEQLKKDLELLKEQTAKQKQLQDEQIEKERDAVDARASEMERSLSKLQDFYEDHSGIYEGTMIRGGDRFSIRVILSPSIPRYSDSRTRTPAEIEAELTALSFHAQIIQWIPPSKDSVGCRITGLRPDTKKGKLTIVSPDCPSSYAFSLNRTSIGGSAQTENSADPFTIFAERTGNAPAKRASAKTKKKAVKP